MGIGPSFVYGLWALVCLAALLRPHVGLIGYFGFAIFCPQWYWIYDKSVADFPFQKYIAAATFIGMLLTGFQGNKLRGTVVLSLAGLLLFYASSLLASTWTIDREYTEFFMTSIWKIVLMTAIAVYLLTTPNRILWAIWVAVIAHSYSAYRVNEKYWEQGFLRLYDFQWNFLDNNTYTISSIPIMAFTASLVLCAPRLWMKGVAGICFLLQAHQVMLLESRGCMLAALFLGGLILVFMPKNFWTIGALALGILLVIRLAGPRVIEEFNSSFAKRGDLDASAESRFLLWKAGMEITYRNPMGVGPWAGQLLVPYYYDGVLDRHDKKALHNLFFEVATGSGIPAVIGLVVFYWSIWVRHLRLAMRGWKSYPVWMQTAALSLLGGVPAYWMASMFSSGALIESPYLLVSVGSAAILVHEREAAAKVRQLALAWPSLFRRPAVSPPFRGHSPA